jgi:protein-L-isoaspartate O-methyltransferase
MCLEALECAVKPGVRVLDVGCGSGILSIAAAKLGAASVLALDIDPDCVRITRENAERNGCADLIDARRGSLSSRDALGGEFEIIVANIIAGTIIDLASEFLAVLAPNGRLVASGIIGEREAAVAGYEQPGDSARGLPSPYSPAVWLMADCCDIAISGQSAVTRSNRQAVKAIDNGLVFILLRLRSSFRKIVVRRLIGNRYILSAPFKLRQVKPNLSLARHCRF